MRTSLWLVVAGLSVGVAAPRTARHSAPETAEAAPVAGQDSSTLDDQIDLGVTVYNSDIALVRDVRDIQLPRGSFDLRFMDIAATVNPAWVLGLSDRLGTLEPGKRADFVVLDADEFRMVPYRPGHNPVQAPKSAVASACRPSSW